MRSGQSNKTFGNVEPMQCNWLLLERSEITRGHTNSANYGQQCCWLSRSLIGLIWFAAQFGTFPITELSRPEIELSPICMSKSGLQFATKFDRSLNWSVRGCFRWPLYVSENSNFGMLNRPSVHHFWMSWFSYWAYSGRSRNWLDHTLWLSDDCHSK